MIGRVTKNIKAGEVVKYKHVESAYFSRVIPEMCMNWLVKFLERYEVN